MGGRSIQQRLAAVLAADMVGYTRLMEKDTEGAVAAWQAVRDDVINPMGNRWRIEVEDVQKSLGLVISVTAIGLKMRAGMEVRMISYSTAASCLRRRGGRRSTMPLGPSRVLTRVRSSWFMRQLSIFCAYSSTSPEWAGSPARS